MLKKPDDNSNAVLLTIELHHHDSDIVVGSICIPLWTYYVQGNY